MYFYCRWYESLLALPKWVIDSRLPRFRLPEWTRDFEIFTCLWCYTSCVGGHIPTFRENLSVPSVKTKQFFLDCSINANLSDKVVSKRQYIAINLHCVTAQKTEGLNLNIGRSLNSHKRPCSCHRLATNHLPVRGQTKDNFLVTTAAGVWSWPFAPYGVEVTKLWSLATAPNVFKAPCLTKLRNKSVLTSTTSSRKVTLSEQQDWWKRWNIHRKI